MVDIYTIEIMVGIIIEVIIIDLIFLVSHFGIGIMEHIITTVIMVILQILLIIIFMMLEKEKIIIIVNQL